MSADDGITYRRGDLDPTSAPQVNRCYPVDRPFKWFWCTWERGHAHSQHVAGYNSTMLSTVMHVWPVIS